MRVFQALWGHFSFFFGKCLTVINVLGDQLELEQVVYTDGGPYTHIVCMHSKIKKNAQSSLLPIYLHNWFLIQKDVNRTMLIVVCQVFNTLWGTLVSLLFATSDKLECKLSRRSGDKIDELRYFNKIGTSCNYTISLEQLSNFLSDTL